MTHEQDDEAAKIWNSLDPTVRTLLRNVPRGDVWLGSEFPRDDRLYLYAGYACGLKSRHTITPLGERVADHGRAIITQRPLHLEWNGTEWIDDRCGCRYHPDDPNGTHGGAPHVHPCDRHAAPATVHNTRKPEEARSSIDVHAQGKIHVHVLREHGNTFTRVTLRDHHGPGSTHTLTWPRDTHERYIGIRFSGDAGTTMRLGRLVELKLESVTMGFDPIMLTFEDDNTWAPFDADVDAVEITIGATVAYGAPFRWTLDLLHSDE